MPKNKPFLIGAIGTIVAVICCVTPILAIALPAVGLTAMMGYLYNDAVLIPALVLFTALAGFGIWRSKTA